AGLLTASIGRKNSLIISALLFLLSAWGSGIADSLTVLSIYRIIGGIGVGIASMSAPMYIAEISPADKRGKMVSLYQLAVVLGFFVVFLTTWLIGGGPESAVDIHEYNVQEGWRAMFHSELIPAFLFLVLLFFVPKSPRWLAMHGQMDKAQSALEQLMPADQASIELKEISASFGEDQGIVWTKIFGPKFRYILIIGILLSVFQQITGINAILYYGAEIFSNALQYGPEDALKQQLWLGAVNLVFTVIAIFTIDKWGRKPLLLLGSFGMLLGLIALGSLIFFEQLGVMAMTSMLLFCGAFSLSMGPVVWVMLSEIFPNKYRSAMMSIAVAAQWLFNAFVANSFPIINRSELNQDSFNGSLPYFIFAAMTLLAIIFVVKMIPETKNKSLEEIEKHWKK
ncbi:MAG: SP family xylose:H+ symportor-like MFS transporter, partial [Flavobacteriales bacterium]